MRAYRIADDRFPIFDGGGAARNGGRWNSVGRPAIYASETYAGAILEVLVHINLGRLTKHQVAVEIDIPEKIPVETLEREDLRGWDAADPIASRRFGDRWLEELRTPVLMVPSVVTRGKERNVLLNPNHPAFSKITASKPQPVSFDPRLIRRLS